MEPIRSHRDLGLGHGVRRAPVVATAIIALVAAMLTAVPTAASPALAAASPIDTYLVSRADAGTSDQSSVSSDGQHVVFRTTEALVAADTNDLPDVYLASAVAGSDDPFSGAPQLVSVRADGGAAADGASSEPVSSADGRYVAFTSTATDLTTDAATPGRRHVFVRDILLGVTIRIQTGADEPDGDSWQPDISSDGARLVFTSLAANLVGGDIDGAADVFAVDRDPDGDGALTSLSIRSATAQVAAPSGDAAISGNGQTIIYRSIGTGGVSQRPGGQISSADFATLSGGNIAATLGQVGLGASAIDDSGDLIAAVLYSECGGETVAAFTTRGVITGAVAVGRGEPLIDHGVGHITDIAISGDGSRIAWASTQPELGATELDHPVVRAEEPYWPSAVGQGGIACDPPVRFPRLDLGPGDSPGLSASGRSVVSSAPTSLAPGAEAAVLDSDTHSNTAGLAVTSAEGNATAPAYLTQAAIASFPASAVHDLGEAFANAPIHNLPIHNLPIHNLPIHNLPIHNLPIHNLPIHNLPIHNLALPGGWADVLAGTPFAGRSELEITLAEVLDWADATRADQNATTEELAAVARIDALTLDSVGIDGTGIDALSLGALMLGETPVATLHLPGKDASTAAWQDLVTAQGLDVTVGDATTLAELDWAGLDVARTGVDEVPLRSIDPGPTLLGTIPAGELQLSGTVLGEVAVADLSDAASVLPAGATGTLAGNVGSFLPGTTAATLAGVVPESVTFGDLLTALLDRASYPWEQIDPSSLNAGGVARAISNFGCGADASCVPGATFSFAFDPGPGEPTVFPQAVAQLFTPAGTEAGLQVSSSGPQSGTGMTAVPEGTLQLDRNRARVALGDTLAGTVLHYKAGYVVTSVLDDGSVRAELTVGTHTASASTAYHRDLANYDDKTMDPVHGSWPTTPAPAMEEGVVYYGWVSPEYKDLNDNGGISIGPAADDDFYRIAAPPPGHRVVVSTNATDGQLSLALYRPADATTELGVTSAGPAPGTATTEQPVGTDGTPSTIGSDAATELAGSELVDQQVVAGDGTAQVVAAGIGDEDLLLRVSSGNGLPSSSLYSLRVQYIAEPTAPACSAWSPPSGSAPGDAFTGDAVDDATNTLYVLDAQRFDATWGAGAAAGVAEALHSLDGTGTAGSAPIDGAVVSIGGDAGVSAARAILDADPCDMSARAALTKAVNTAVKAAVGSHRDQIGSIVIVGGDDILPMAPVAQNTNQFNEQSHAADLRLPSPPGGAPDDPCPPLAADAVDPCATPLSAAAATNHILTDDPYAFATAYRTAGGSLYVPSVAIGRLVDSPADIAATVDRFIANDGQLKADSTLTGGYGAWSSLPDAVTSELAWRSTSDTKLAEPWSAGDLTSRLFPATGASAAVVSVNAHFDETRMLPGVDGAEQGVFTPGDLYSASAATAADRAKLAGSVLFTIGCHAGNNLPQSYYPGTTDWVDVFGGAAAFVGNTGYGLANDTTTALSARLLQLYAQWIGVTSDAGPVSSGDALVQAKRAYLAGLGLYSGYDEKALMEAVYYGLPMYTFAHSTKTPPLPKVPAYLDPVPLGGDLTAASLTLRPGFDAQSSGDSSYLTIDGEAPAVVAGEPVLPKTTLQLKKAELGKAVRGALITGLESRVSATTTPLIADGTAGVASDADGTRSDIVFPSTFAHVTTQQTPTGPVDLLVLTPARVQARVGGTGTVETFPRVDVQVLYGPASSTDVTPPVITGVDTAKPGRLRATVDGTGSEVVRVLALVQFTGSPTWVPYELVEQNDGWEVGVEPPDDRPYRWIMQAVDAAGNVGISSNRGLIGTAGPATPPTLAGLGGDDTAAVGTLVTRTVEVTDAAPADRITATWSVTSGDNTVAGGTAPVTVGEDGVTRIAFEHTPLTPGSYTASVTACRAGACTTASFVLTVPEENQAPTAEVSLSPSGDLVSPTATLTATAHAQDPDGDPVSVAYRWLRNGLPIPDQALATLALTGLVQPGDTVTAEVVASDGRLSGGAARSSVVVGTPPTITADAHTSMGAYTEGAWSRTAVTVEFHCTGSLPLDCPAPQTIASDTSAAGVLVSGRVVDGTGGTATTSLLVRVDATAPTLHPLVTPDPVVHDQPATATAQALDFGSGVASSSCDTPSTATVGQGTVACRATDAAGNTAAGTATFLVLPRTPLVCGGLPDRSALPPLNPDGSSVFVRISSVPLSFRACDESGRSIGTAGFVTSITLVSSAPLPRGAHVTERPLLQAGSAPAYSRTGQVWSAVLSTKGLTPARIYTYRVLLADGTSFTFTFGIR